MDGVALLHVLAAMAEDDSLAILTGLLLAQRWSLQVLPVSSRGRRHSGLQNVFFAASALLTLAVCMHFYMLIVSFTGHASPDDCLRNMPDLVSTHAGKVIGLSILAALALFLSRWVSVSDSLSRSLATMLLGAVFLLRSAVGHAAADGAFSRLALLQFVHLVSVAVWSGGVLVSAFYLPGLARIEGASSFALARLYLDRLSYTSTWAVGLVLLTGLLKSYLALGGNVHLLRSGLWGTVLVIKTACVGVALALGGLNRTVLRRSRRWNSAALRRSFTALRLEALCMVAILALSALLGNVEPPDLS